MPCHCRGVKPSQTCLISSYIPQKRTQYLLLHRRETTQTCPWNVSVEAFSLSLSLSLSAKSVSLISPYFLMYFCTLDHCVYEFDFQSGAHKRLGVRFKGGKIFAACHAAEPVIALAIFKRLILVSAANDAHSPIPNLSKSCMYACFVCLCSLNLLVFFF
jgi:hypothetical protein